MPLVQANPHSLALIVQLLMSLWLGLYILTHGAHNRASRLAAAAMLSMAGYFFAATMLLNSLLRDSAVFWARTMRLFGPPFLVLFLHMTVELLPPGNVSRARRIVRLIYAFAAALATVGLFTNLLYADVRAAPYYDRPSVIPGPLYVIHVVFVLTIFVLSIVNLRTSWRRSTDPSLRRWFLILLLAFFCLLVGAAYLSTTLFLSISWPALLGHILLGGGLMLLGYSVAHQSALVEGRALRRDFLYSLGSAAGGVGAFFSLILVLQRWTDQKVSVLTLVGVGATIIGAFSLQNWVRDRSDVLLYREEAWRVRKYLRALARESATEMNLGPRLRSLLDSLCEAVGASEGRIILRGGEDWQPQAIHSGGSSSSHAGGTDDPEAPYGLVSGEAIGLAVPLRMNEQRVGVVVLGCKEDGRPFTEEERELAQVLAERVVNILESVSTQAEMLRRVAEAELATQELRRRERALQIAFVSRLAMLRKGHADTELGRHLRGSLRNLWDVPRLAKSPLVRMPVVQGRLGRFSPGRALQEVLLAAIDRTKPPDSIGSGKALLRYGILRRSFVGGETVSEITTALAISERQYYREMNAALEAVQASLEEMNKELETARAEAGLARA
ncbi:MAG TPA: histidine kinase N-terminal 7TM domain-containing protein [Anaerolineae bacterium]|nr:histidine kinase N-terminal 7TM domain-containing protein [Anaerolineae bacterium]